MKAKKALLMRSALVLIISVLIASGLNAAFPLASRAQTANPPAEGAGVIENTFKDRARPPAPPEPLDVLKESLQKCASIDKDRSLRLQCYDEAAVAAGVLAVSEQKKTSEVVAKYGFWRVIEGRNDFGDYTISLKLEPSSVSPVTPTIRKPSDFVIKCSLKKTNVYLDWKYPVVIVRRGQASMPKTLEIAYKMDEDSTRREDWDVSIDRLALFSQNPVEFVRSVKNKKSLIFEFTPQNDSTQSLKFNMEGLNNALDVLVKKCYN